MRLSPLIAAILAAAFTGACSAVSGMETDLSARPGYRGHGVYVLTDEEQRHDCKSLVFVIEKSIQTINGIPYYALTQRDQPPLNVVNAVQRVAGGGIPALEDFKRERARIKALQQASEQKNCPPIDVDGRTKDATEKLETFRKDLKTSSTLKS